MNMTRIAFAAVALMLLAVPALAQDANPLLDPASFTEQAPETFKAKFETSKGEFVIEVTRAWSPNGADRFYNLVKSGFYDECRFFRIVPNFVVQWGMNGDPAVTKAWRTATIQDDPVKQSNKPGYITFAKTGAPNSRTTQLFINLRNNANLDGMGFAPFGVVAEGDMEVVNALYSGYGEGAPRGRGPGQGEIAEKGNAYLKAEFDKLDYIKKASIVE